MRLPCPPPTLFITSIKTYVLACTQKNTYKASKWTAMRAYEQTACTLVGCFTHVRRKFTEVKKAQRKKKRQVRQKMANPLLDKSAPHIPPKTVLGKPSPTISGCGGPMLIHYIEHDHPTTDNNRAERTIKPLLSAGRTGCLAILKTTQMPDLVETVKANGLHSF